VNAELLLIVIDFKVTKDARTDDVFRRVILRLYKAYSFHESQPDRLHPIETLEQLYQREMRYLLHHFPLMIFDLISYDLILRIRSYVGVDVPLTASVERSAILHTNQLRLSAPSAGDLGYVKNERPASQKPFHSKELLWSSR
jgi:hypothetical protein